MLIGDARVWQDDNVVTGDTITIYLSEDRSVVQAGKQGRVKALFFPKDRRTRPADEGAGAPQAATACAN